MARVAAQPAAAVDGLVAGVRPAGGIAGTGDRNMEGLVTTETALSRQFSSEDLKRRIELNRQVRFGLEQASPAQLNMIYILCQRWRLDPMTDITLYQGRTWITLDGHLRKMREHPDYLGYNQRPLTQQEKADGGWAKDDIVWETTVRTARHGAITQWGKVTKAEVEEAQSAARGSGRRSAPLGLHPVEIAQKRSLARAHRFAFGMDLPDEEELEREVTEELERRADPERNRMLVDQYDRIYGREVDEASDPMVRTGDALANELAQLVEAAAAGELDYADARVGLPAPEAQVRAAIEKLQLRIEEAEADDDRANAPG